MGIDKDAGANTQVPAYLPGKQPDFIPDAIYNSATPISTAQDVKTSASTDQCWSDYTAQHIKLDNAGQLKIRNMAYNFAKPNTDTTLPDFEASEPED